jgi:hypothetical protein
MQPPKRTDDEENLTLERVVARLKAAYPCFTLQHELPRALQSLTRRNGYRFWKVQDVPCHGVCICRFWRVTAAALNATET